MKKVFALILSLTLALSLTGCGEKRKGAGDTAYRLDTPVLSLDWRRSADGDAFELIGCCLDGLLKTDADGGAVPALAEDRTVSEDGLRWTFRLREAEWSNGEPVTAADFVFAWREAVSERTEYSSLFGTAGACIRNAEEILNGDADPETLGVSAEDDRTLVVELSAAVPCLEELLCLPVFTPLNQKFYEKCGESYGSSADSFLSCGAYTVESFSADGSALTLKKNKKYWNAEQISASRLSFQYAETSDAELSEMSRAGEFWYLSFSVREEASGTPLANRNFRLALTSAIDREKLVRDCLGDGAAVTLTAVPQGVSVSEAGDFSADQLKFSDACSYDSSKAWAFLAAAKAELGTEEIGLTLLYGDNEGEEVLKVAESIRAQLEENLPGVTVKLVPVSKAERLEKLRSGDYELALTHAGSDYPDPLTFLRLWTSGSAANYGAWSNPEYDSLLEKYACDTGSGEEVRRSLLYSAEALLLNEAVIAPLYTETGAASVSAQPEN